jgi:hypothetical protein
VGEGNVVALPSSGEMAGCIGTVRLDRGQVPALVTALVDGLAGVTGSRATTAPS